MLTLETNYIKKIKFQNSNNNKKNNETVILNKQKSQNSNLLIDYLNGISHYNSINIASKNPIQINSSNNFDYQNDLRTLFNTNNAKILAIIPRSFNAKDKNGNDYIDNNEEHGTFNNAIERLDEIKQEGFNTLHLLPINPPGKTTAMGTAGSVYAPSDMLKIDPMLIDKNDKRSDKEQFKNFVNECHKRNIRVMVDMPSCASCSLYEERPELMAHERNGLAKTPQGWVDIRMFQPWEDEGKRTLNPELLKYHKDFVDLMIDSGVDGIRADVARAKPVEFWDIIIPYSRKRDPQFAWLAESYTYEDASPQANMPYDRPEDSLRAGFDAIYGQYHIFHEWEGAKALHDYVIDNLNMSYRVDKGKSLIGSFATHDDISPMLSGGSLYCNLISGLQATLPMLNPYFVDGFQSGDYYDYKFKDKTNFNTLTDSTTMTTHQNKLDIFNLSRKPEGKNPQIGNFMTKAFKMREKYKDIINRGSYIVLDKKKDPNDQIITFARHRLGKTLLVIANKNVNRQESCIITIPTIKPNQKLINLLPNYGEKSTFQIKGNDILAQVAPGRIHVFEIDTPLIENNCDKVYKQH